MEGTETVEPAAEELAADTADQDTQPTSVAFDGNFDALDLNDPAAVIRAAAFLLRRDGWLRHQYNDRETGARCIYGALRDVYDLAGAPRPDQYSPAYCQHGSSYYGIAQYLERRASEWHESSVVGFNDGIASGAEDAFGFLDRAADEYDPALNLYAPREGTSYWEVKPNLNDEQRMAAADVA